MLTDIGYLAFSLWAYGQKCHFPREQLRANFHPELGSGSGSGPGSGPGSRPGSNEATKATRPQKQQGRKSNKATKATRPQKQQGHKNVTFQRFHVIFKGPGLGFSRISRFNGAGFEFSRISRHFQGPRHWIFEDFV